MSASGMYSLKPVYTDTKVEMPTCMYAMKSLHGESGEMQTIPATNDPDLQALMDRDQKISADLAQLTNEMKKLSEELGHTFGESSPIVPSSSNNKMKMSSNLETTLPKGVCDLVISVSPSRPSLSSILIAEVLKSNGIHVAMTVQKHSSLKEDIPGYMGAVRGRTQVNVEKVVFTYVWKEDLLTPSVMQSPLRQAKIVGDANVGRFLCRMLCPQLYDESNIDNATLMDKWIDLSVQMTNGSNKEKEAVMKEMNSYLGKNDYFCGVTLTLADITLLAAVLSNMNSFKAVPKNVKKWLGSMKEIFGDFFVKFSLPATWSGQ